MSCIDIICVHYADSDTYKCSPFFVRFPQKSTETSLVRIYVHEENPPCCMSSGAESMDPTSSSESPPRSTTTILPHPQNVLDNRTVLSHRNTESVTGDTCFVLEKGHKYPYFVKAKQFHDRSFSIKSFIPSTPDSSCSSASSSRSFTPSSSSSMTPMTPRTPSTPLTPLTPLSRAQTPLPFTSSQADLRHCYSNHPQVMTSQQSPPTQQQQQKQRRQHSVSEPATPERHKRSGLFSKLRRHSSRHKLAIDENTSAMLNSDSCPDLGNNEEESIAGETPNGSPACHQQEMNPNGCQDDQVMMSNPTEPMKKKKWMDRWLDKINRETHHEEVLTPPSDFIKRMKLKKEVTKITLKANGQTIEGRIFLWDSKQRCIISDIDGTITRSDTKGHILTRLGVNYCHRGIISLFNQLSNKGYKIMYLTARPITLFPRTRDYICRIQEGTCKMPIGPVITAPNKTWNAFARELIIRKPETFKIAILKTIRELFPADHNPFVAGWGNRTTDDCSYISVGIEPSRAFRINCKGEIVTSDDQFSSMSHLDNMLEKLGVFPHCRSGVSEAVQRYHDLQETLQHPLELVVNMNRKPKGGIDIEKFVREQYSTPGSTET